MPGELGPPTPLPGPRTHRSNVSGIELLKKKDQAQELAKDIINHELQGRTVSLRADLVKMLEKESHRVERMTLPFLSNDEKGALFRSQKAAVTKESGNNTRVDESFRPLCALLMRPAYLDWITWKFPRAPHSSKYVTIVLYIVQTIVPPQLPLQNGSTPPRGPPDESTQVRSHAKPL
jgi:hypothetical protein